MTVTLFPTVRINICTLAVRKPCRGLFQEDELYGALWAFFPVEKSKLNAGPEKQEPQFGN